MRPIASRLAFRQRRFARTGQADLSVLEYGKGETAVEERSSAI